MTRALLILAVLVAGAAYVLGSWPQRQARLAAERELQETRTRLTHAEARIRLYALLSRLLALLGSVEARNYGDAQGQSTAFFDAVRREADDAEQAGARAPLEQIHADRDRVTIALTRADPAALEMLRGAMARLRAALGEAPPPAAAPQAVPTGPSTAPESPSPLASQVTPP
ncbi:MAG TPA: hypothetical protein VFM88_14895 [Vicinamibacteria bacterium]|nr:hypothetical protein [Vicinamibacteria bacterium]